MAKLQKAKDLHSVGKRDLPVLYQDIPGPSSFQELSCSSRVFRCACIMFGVVSIIAALENYFRHIEELVTQYPSAGV